MLATFLFQSTLPLRGATDCRFVFAIQCIISIHAPLTGSDKHYLRGYITTKNFNPRSPYGERPKKDTLLSVTSRNFNPRSPYGERRSISFNPKKSKRFQSTLPLRGATSAKVSAYIAHTISIHAPLTGSDGTWSRRKAPLRDFNPRSPYGERHGFVAGWIIPQ